MKAVLDTNVLISGIFFSGPPRRILKAWRDGGIEPVVSAQILVECRQLAARLSGEFPEVDLGPFLDLLESGAAVVEERPISGLLCDDPEDDRFMACGGTW